MKKTICIFGGSSSGKGEENKIVAKKIGEVIAQNNFNLIFGGGENGIMGAIASSVIENGGKTTGIIPKFLLKTDILNKASSLKYNSRLITTETMHQRKKIMYDKSDGFLVLPGGIGTLDECCEILTWCQLNLIKNKNIGIVNFTRYWDPLINLINHLVREEFMGPNNLKYFEEIKDTKALKIFLKNI